MTDPALLQYVPEGQGEVPWHQNLDTRLTDALVARINVSNGNLMLAVTDFDITGVGKTLRSARTYNSLDAPAGRVSQRWWSEYERYLQLLDAEVVFYDPTGAAVRFKKNGNTFTTPKGYSKELKKNANGSYALTDWDSGSTEHFDAGGTLTKVTDRNNGAITITQHPSTTATKAAGEPRPSGFKLVEERSGRTLDLYRTEDRQWEVQDHAERSAVFDLDEDGNLIATTDTAGKTTRFTYDAGGRITKVTTPEGRETAFTYDAEGRVTSMQRGRGGPVWTYRYSAETPSQAGTTTVADPEEDETVYHHNAEGEVTKVTDPLKHERSRTYNAHKVATATDALGNGSTPGNTTTYGWDNRNNPTSRKLPTGATASLTGYQTIAGTDLPGSITSPDGQKSDYGYDTNGNTLSVAITGNEGGKRTFTYNKATPQCGGFEGQRCTATDARGKKTSFTYDHQGNLTKVTPPSPLGPTIATYDTWGRPATVTDGRGTKLTYTYDTRDRAIKVASASGDTVVYTWDGDGNPISRIDRTGTTAYTYDALSRETVRTLQDGSQAVLTYTPSEGNVDSYTDPTGTVHYTWDAANRLTRLKDPAGRETTYEYNNNDARTQTTYPGGTRHKITLDKSGRPQRITTTSGSETLFDLSYDYAYTSGGTTKDGTKIRKRTDHTTDKMTTYTYDSQDRLHYTAETQGGQKRASWLYCHDAAGNLTAQSGVADTCPAGNRFTYNDASQLTAKNDDPTGWSYDKAGNETSAASVGTTTRTDEHYNDYAQLTELTAGGTNYQARYADTTNAERTRLGDTDFHHGPLGLAGITAGGTDTGFVREPAGTLNSMTRGVHQFYYLTDATGSVIGLTDHEGRLTHSYAYGPTGLPRTTPTEKTPQPYQYAGTYKDPTGLYKMGARYYDPHTARFTQPDPSGQETNRYLYATADPINHTDPQGLFAWGEYAKECATSGVQSTAINVGTGVTETGVGAAAAFGSGCAEGVGIQLVKDYVSEDVGSAIESATNIKDLKDVGKSVKNIF
ncbi:RHS repeat-associated core domain-containing protein [Streptomyces buecherae]|uniref:RHS repeat-associated core domain-containing protein n=1 Tax=Streptomyces buecherae TaxID=2763006 RepID=UPI0033F2FE6E